ncbi:MAG: ankyrin repeat domain-containing protein [Pseudomonadota bacterium]
MKRKTRQTLEEMLAALSDTMFPAELGRAKVMIDSRAPDGDTPLHALVQNGNRYGVRMLIEEGADVNAVGDLGYTPLHLAAWRGEEDMVMWLIQAGADVNMRCEVGKTPYQLAEQGLRPEIVKVFDTSTFR